jgi:Ca-activated chloride channel family protein
VPYDRFQWPLALGLACLLLDLAWRVRRSGREEQGAAPRLAAALLPLFAPLAPQEPFEPGELLASAVRHHRSNEPEAAEQAARALLGHASELSEPEQAKVHFTLGVVAATRAIENPEEGEPQRAAARDAFSAARALAGPGELREDATYDLGALELFHAESVRATIPEISGQPPAAPGALGTPPGAPPAAPPGPEKDPLKEARALYGAAKEWFLERLRLGWQDEDTRANLELIQRRLHELDRLEKQREEQQQQQQGSDQNQPDQNEKDKQDKQDSQDQKGQQDQKDQKNPQDDPDAKDEQKDGQKDAEKKDQPQSDAEQKDPTEQQQRPEEAENKDGSESEPPKDAQQEPAERVLTREEVMQLLDKLAELEKQQKAIDAALRAKRRAAKKRDW